MQQEIREVFLNAQFVKPVGCTDSTLEATVCPGYVLVIRHDDPAINVSLGEDWTGVQVHTEIDLDDRIPDWPRFRRWLWNACYEEIRVVMATVCKTLGISVPWPVPIESDGRKHFPGREPLVGTSNVFEELTEGEGSAHIIAGQIGSGKTTLALRFALDAVLANRSVLFASMVETTAGLAARCSALLPGHMPTGLLLTSLTGQGIGPVLKQCEKKLAVAKRDLMGSGMSGVVLVLDSTFAKFGDQPKRMAMKTHTEVIIVTQASREATEQTFLSSMPKRLAQTVDSVYWTVAADTPFKVLKHRTRGGVRLMPEKFVPPPALPRARFHA